MAFLEEVLFLGAGSEIRSLTLLPAYSFCLMLTAEDVSSQVPAPVPKPAAHYGGLSGSRTLSQNKSFHKLLLVNMFYHSKKKINIDSKYVT